MRIALIQLSVVDGAPSTNLEHAEALMRDASDADLFLLPEVWPTGYDRNSWPHYVEKQHSSVIERCFELAKELNCWIGGSYVCATDTGEYANRFILVSPEGTTAAHYDKVHLFAPLEEDKHFVPGAQRVHVQLESWHAQLSICYDLRFPGMYRQSAVEGVELFLIVSQWPQERCHHMVALAQARAIENQAYVALCNRIGTSKQGLQFGGRSGIWDPSGKQLANAQTEECVVTASIELEEVRRVRQEISLFNKGLAGVDY